MNTKQELEAETYDFEPILFGNRQPRGQHFIGASLSATGLILSRKMVEMIPEAKVFVAVDSLKNAILLTPTAADSIDAYALIKRPNQNVQIANKQLAKLLPLGRYFFTKEQGNGLVLTLGEKS